MKVLFISNDLIAGNLAYLLKKEGHEVRLYIDDRKRRKNLTNLVKKISDWKSELEWVGKDGLIVFDDVGYGKEQDNLRDHGYKVVGGSELGDKIELDRAFGNEMFLKYSVPTPFLKDFENIRDAIEFVEDNRRPWVIKQNNHHYSKVLNYVGRYDDARDVKSLLINYLKNPKVREEKITLQERVDGIEIGVGRYFNGEKFVGPIEYNIEYTRFFPGDIGPLTSEMGTLAWYSSDYDNKLYKETLEKLETFLIESKFRGDFEVDCIVNEDGPKVIECTSRFGSPIVHLQSEIHSSPWGDFLNAIATNNEYDLRYKEGFGIVVLIAVPPFPYVPRLQENFLSNIDIYFDDTSDEFMSHIHFEEVSKYKNTDSYYISDNRGYILYVTGVADSVEKCRNIVYERINKISIPKMMYRNDIGVKFIAEEAEKLRKWGYL